MPETAKQTAGWLGLPLPTLDELYEPDVNLAIGARYLDAMHRQLGGNSFLALAAYNAGAGNVGNWIEQTGNPPTDELVERIPFEETRGYVKRVMGSWQTMRWWFDRDEPPFPDLVRFSHAALPP
jgi:soluble lytic murein transglycosylase